MNSRRKELKKYDRLDKGKKKKALTTSWSDDEEEEQDKYNLAFMARSSYSSDDEVEVTSSTCNYLSDDDLIDDDELHDAYLLLQNDFEKGLRLNKKLKNDNKKMSLEIDALNKKSK